MKGLVVEIKDRNAVILTDDGEFRTVTNFGYKVGQSITVKTQKH